MKTGACIFAVTGLFLVGGQCWAAVDCKHIAAGIQARSEAGEFPTATAMTSAKIDALTACHVNMGPPVGDLLQKELDLAGKVDRGEMTKEQANAQMKLAVARARSDHSQGGDQPNVLGDFLKGYAAATPKSMDCRTDALGATHCVEH